MSAEKLVRPVFETKRVLPFLNLVRPPTITCTDGQKGIFVKAELNEKGKYNVYLDSGHVIYNVDWPENFKVVTGEFSLLSGDAVIVCNLTSSGTVIPWSKVAAGESNVELVKMQRDHYKELAMSAQDDLQTAAGGNRAMEKMEELGEAAGRIQAKIHGKMVFGRQEIQEHMTPELESLIGSQSGGGDGD